MFSIMKSKRILYLVIGILFVVTFLFQVIPIPVNEAIPYTPESYEGTYWTSGLYQLSVSNHQATLSYFSVFIVLIGGTSLLKE